MEMYSQSLLIMLVTLFVSGGWRFLFLLFVKFPQERKATKQTSKCNTVKQGLKIYGMYSHGSQWIIGL
jgi:hypothetical protein